MNYLVGLTGGIGSGKSTVADMFAERGVRIIDADAISHSFTQAGGAAIAAIRDSFGTEFIDQHGALDRPKMRETVFADAAAKQRLESILHPLILARIKSLAACATDAPYTLIVIPLLFESGRYADWLQRVITVDCPEEIQIARSIRRSHLDESAVRAIMTQQLDNAQRLRLAHEAIRNDGSLIDLQDRVAALHGRLSALAAESD